LCQHANNAHSRLLAAKVSCDDGFDGASATPALKR
jgi:hypothetical protein